MDVDPTQATRERDVATDPKHLCVHRTYAITSILENNGPTLVHYGLGAAVMIPAYGRWPGVGWSIGWSTWRSRLLRCTC